LHADRSEKQVDDVKGYINEVPYRDAKLNLTQTFQYSHQPPTPSSQTFFLK